MAINGNATKSRMPDQARVGVGQQPLAAHVARRLANKTPKGRSPKEKRYTKLFYDLFDSPEYAALSVAAKALLIELHRQYNGFNNGDLCAAWSLMERRGIGSRGTVRRAAKELDRKGFVLRTRYGNRSGPNLYALTCFKIDECEGKGLNAKPTKAPLNLWKLGANPEYKGADNDR